MMRRSPVASQWNVAAGSPRPSRAPPGRSSCSAGDGTACSGCALDHVDCDDEVRSGVEYLPERDAASDLRGEEAASASGSLASAAPAPGMPAASTASVARISARARSISATNPSVRMAGVPPRSRGRRTSSRPCRRSCAPADATRRRRTRRRDSRCTRSPTGARAPERPYATSGDPLRRRSRAASRRRRRRASAGRASGSPRRATRCRPCARPGPGWPRHEPRDCSRGSDARGRVARRRRRGRRTARPAPRWPPSSSGARGLAPARRSRADDHRDPGTVTGSPSGGRTPASPSRRSKAGMRSVMSALMRRITGPTPSSVVSIAHT